MTQFNRVRLDSSNLTEFEKEIGKTLRRLRRDAELTQEEVALKMGISQQQIQKCEASGRVTVTRLFQYCATLDESAGEVLANALAKIGLKL